VGGSRPRELASYAGVGSDRREHCAVMGSPVSVGVTCGHSPFEADPCHCSIGPGPIC
jgi:hypothetical protein